MADGYIKPAAVGDHDAHVIGEDRFIKIETKIAYQENTIQELNKVICQQQIQIDGLESTCKSLMDHVKALMEVVSEGKIPVDVPPHY